MEGLFETIADITKANSQAFNSGLEMGREELKAENARLRERVAELEAENERLNKALDMNLKNSLDIAGILSGAIGDLRKLKEM